MVDEKIESLRTQVEDLSSRIPGIEAEIVKGEQFNSQLESRIEELKRELLGLQSMPVEDDSASQASGPVSPTPQRAALPDPTQKVVFAKTKIFDSKAAQAAAEVSALSYRVGSKSAAVFDEPDSDSDED
jgi:cell division septum initiation protein DivIVA